MSLISRDQGGKDFKLAPQGTHLARCYLLADIGYQETNFGTKLQVVLGWEFPSELLDDGRPMIIYKTYTNSMNEKANLRKDVESWRGKKLTETEAGGFDLRNVLGHACQLSIVHNVSGDRTYANIFAVTGILKGSPVPEAVNENIIFDIDSGDSAGDLPEWIQKKISEAKADTSLPGETENPAMDEDFDDDIPF